MAASAAAGTTTAATTTTTIIRDGPHTFLDTPYDPSYEPSGKELQEYAARLGIDVVKEANLLWIARTRLKAALPSSWKACVTDSGEIYYLKVATGESMGDHPMDSFFRQKVIDERSHVAAGGASREDEASWCGLIANVLASPAAPTAMGEDADDPFGGDEAEATTQQQQQKPKRRTVLGEVAVPESGATYTADDGTLSVVLSDKFSPDYEPPAEEIKEYAEWLGIDMVNEAYLVPIARDGLRVPLPAEWKPCKTDGGEVYYFNFKSGESLWDHPMDSVFKARVAEARRLHGAVPAAAEVPSAAGASVPTAPPPSAAGGAAVKAPVRNNRGALS